MEIAESMRSTAENIIGSYNVRVKALGDLVVDTQKTLKGFASDRKKMAREQAESLANFTRGLSKSVEEMLKEFQGSHTQMGKEQAKILMHFITDLTNDVSSMVSGFQKDRGKMSKELKSRLAKEVKEIETYIENRLQEFDEAHTEMSEQQKKDLAKFVSGMTSEVKRLLAGYRNDINGASRAWKGMAATLAKARKGGPVMPRIEAGERVTTVEEAVEKKVKAKRGVKAKGK
jgi:gas vesicle protein